LALIAIASAYLSLTASLAKGSTNVLGYFKELIPKSSMQIPKAPIFAPKDFLTNSFYFELLANSFELVVEVITLFNAPPHRALISISQFSILIIAIYGSKIFQTT